MSHDPILDEIRKLREQHAAKFGFDLQRIYNDVKERERKSGRKIIPAPPSSGKSKSRKRA